MADLLKGTRLGPWVIFRDENGLRHAVRHSAILSVSEADDTGSSTAIQMTGNRLAVVRRAFEEVFAWVAVKAVVGRTKRFSPYLAVRDAIRRS